MAIDAFAHIPSDFPHHFSETGYITVAVNTLNACLDMPLMGEVHSSLRLERINPNPWDLLFPAGKTSDLLDFRAFRLDRLVANHALSHTWNPRRGASLSQIVAETAVNLLVDMDAMWEVNRLADNLSPSACTQDEDQERHNEKSRYPDYRSPSHPMDSNSM